MPWPPTLNTYYRTAGRTTYKSRKGREYEGAAMYLTTERFSGRVAVAVWLYGPTAHPRYDVDNRLKPVLDALENAGVIDNDCLVDRLRVVRKPPVKRPYIVVRIADLQS